MHWDEHDQVAEDPRVGRRLRTDRVFDGADRSDRVHRRADPADALGKGPGITRVAALEDDLDSAEHGRGRPSVCDFALVDFRFDAQVAFDAGHGVDNDMGHPSPPSSVRAGGPSGA